MYCLPELSQSLQKLNAGHLLEVAAGKGKFLTFLLDSFQMVESITGVDINAEDIQQAQESIRFPNADFLETDAYQLSFDNDYFDTAVVSNSLHHFSDPLKVLKEMIRVLVPGGLLLVNELVCTGLSEAQNNHIEYHHLKADIDTALGYTHRHTMDEKSILTLLADLPLETEEFGRSVDPNSLVNSQEKMWRFFKTLDEKVSSAAHLPEAMEFEERASTIKESIKKHGLNLPPQLYILARKNGK